MPIGLFGKGVARVTDILRSRARRILELDDFVHLRRALIELNDVQELKNVFGWTADPLLDDPGILDFRFVEDVNRRRVRDAESLATVVRNINPAACLDIGTGLGHSAALMAVNAPTARLYTVNVSPEDFGAAGTLTTVKLEKPQIGSYYRERNLRNITQILANTAHWEPDIGCIDVAFIDGSHDCDFVINDTLKVLARMRPGSFVLWHDFNLSLIHNYPWIKSVCLGVEVLLARGALTGRVFHIRDSWVGVYRVADT